MFLRYTLGMKIRDEVWIFLIAAGVLGFAFASPTFGDADAYYHLWMAKRIAAHGIVGAFPWLPLTSLASHFADQHFLYHVALMPFLNVLGDFWGLKIATLLFAAAAAAMFCFLLRRYEVKHPFWWTLPLLVAPGFVFRLLLTKATALALCAFFAALIALRSRRKIWLFAVAFAYVWLHAGWPLLFVVGLIDAAAYRSVLNLRAIVAGAVLGLVINPFFPQNLAFYWEQIVRVALIGNRAADVIVGNEWYPIAPGRLLLENAAVFAPIFTVVATFAALIFRNIRIAPGRLTPERRRAIACTGALALALLLMTLRQARHKEYALPVFLLASALIGDVLLAAPGLRAVFARFRIRCGYAFVPIACVVSLALGVFGGREIALARTVYARRTPWTRFAEVGIWMRGHLPADAVVFHTAWDDFPYLVYRDDAQRYIAGLDPRFLSDHDPANYWEWRDISEGRRRLGLASLIEKDFDARYVLLRRDGEPLRALIQKDPSFERVYTAADAEIWRIK